MAFSYREMVRRAFQILRENGGVISSFWRLTRGDDPLKMGALVGTDKYGNKYFENNRYFQGRNRWVEYRKDKYWDLDASMIPAEWHRWLQQMTDDPPTKVPPTPRKFLADHTYNQSGTSGCYVPSTTTPKKIHEWVPPVNTE
ncbi:NADH dehydrogenase [ubiquinone] 1 alpha subcomplex subunit 12-like [Acanthaster planci]|uniref:NADH dehydrogenase [ubiquinone] 1 alpha subcomplex subunit 12 n=1 Tax=Acanthaster planci TaxID=133434 RepID=A0A8B7ZXC9_ACAPL|nr:NADH dehydrogenase [ubiquinone] 1 alpha subcomplex subunit 12-like [Acanthaster planci]